jgi:hypothetical protein
MLAEACQTSVIWICIFYEILFILSTNPSSVRTCLLHDEIASASVPLKEYHKMPAIKRNLKSKDVAHILDMSPDDVIVLARTEKLKGIKKGKYWFFRFQDVESYRKKLAKEEGHQTSA